MNEQMTIGPATTVTPLRRIRSVAPFRNLYVKDESVWPSGTFKDRLALAAVEQAGTNPTTFATLSYGNTAVSIARAVSACRHIAKHAVLIAAPEGFENWKLGPTSTGRTVTGSDILTSLHGLATVVKVDLSSSLFDDDALRQLVLEAGLPAERVMNITEGLTVPAYVAIIREAVEQLGRAPDVCVVPYGAGILCNEILDHLTELGHCRVVPISVSSPTSIAKMLYGPIWLDIDALGQQGFANSRHRSPDRTGAVRHPYRVWRVEEDEILSGLEIARREELSAEPSGAAGLGILHRLSSLVPDIDPERDLVVVINTGNGIDPIAGVVR